MSHIRLKMTLAGLVLLFSVGFLAYAGFNEGSMYYMHVDAFVADSQYHDQPVRLNGVVAQENLDRKSELMVLRFDLLGDSEKLAVVYRGVVPDMFAAGRDVVVEGQLGADGTFEAHTLLTKCASKYESDNDDGGGKAMSVDVSAEQPENYPK